MLLRLALGFRRRSTCHNWLKTSLTRLALRLDRGTPQGDLGMAEIRVIEATNSLGILMHFGCCPP